MERGGVRGDRQTTRDRANKREPRQVPRIALDKVSIGDGRRR